MMEGHSIFTEVNRPVYMEINLGYLSNNVNILREMCTKKTSCIMAVVKAGAYGHGSVTIARHLKDEGVERLAVGTVDEGIHLRKHNLPGPIHILGSIQGWEMPTCVEYSLIPTVSSFDAVTGMAEAIKNIKVVGENDIRIGSVHIKVDTGLSRNGIVPGDLPDIMTYCQNSGVHVEGIMTHFSDSWTNQQLTQVQMATFLKAVKSYQSSDIKLHVANSTAVLNGIGTDLDFIRPGIGLYGVAPSGQQGRFQSSNLQPIASLKCTPILVKQHCRGTSIGYGSKYKVKEEYEWIATFAIGSADGLPARLGSTDSKFRGWLVRDKTREKCPIVGSVSMDMICVKVPSCLDKGEVFTVLSGDFDMDTSACGIANKVGSSACKVLVAMSVRIPRVYVNGRKRTIVHGLSSLAY